MHVSPHPEFKIASMASVTPAIAGPRMGTAARPAAVALAAAPPAERIAPVLEVAPSPRRYPSCNSRGKEISGDTETYIQRFSIRDISRISRRAPPAIRKIPEELPDASRPAIELEVAVAPLGAVSEYVPFAFFVIEVTPCVAPKIEANWEAKELSACVSLVLAAEVGPVPEL